MNKEACENMIRITKENLERCISEREFLKNKQNDNDEFILMLNQTLDLYNQNLTNIVSKGDDKTNEKIYYLGEYDNLKLMNIINSLNNLGRDQTPEEKIRFQDVYNIIDHYKRKSPKHDKVKIDINKLKLVHYFDHPFEKPIWMK